MEMVYILCFAPIGAWLYWMLLLWVGGVPAKEIYDENSAPFRDAVRHLQVTGNAEIDRRRAVERRKEDAIQRQLKAYEESKRNRGE